MPTPTIRYWKKKAVLFKLETVYGTDPLPTGAADWLEARNVTLTPYEADTQDRSIVQPYMGNGSKLIVSTRQKLSFDLALAGSGALGTAPKIGKVMRACGFAETITAGTKVEYTLISDSFESATFYINIDGVLHKGIGARGTCSFKLDGKSIPLLHVELTSLYFAPIDDAPPVVDRSGWPTEKPVNSKNTLICKLNAVDSWYSKFETNVANQVSHDDLPGGYEVIKIGDRQPTASITMLAPTLAVFDPFSLATAATNFPLQVVHGTADGEKVQVDLNGLCPDPVARSRCRQR